MDRIRLALEKIKFKYGDKDPDALRKIESRVAQTGRNGGLISYSEVVKGITFSLPNVNGGNPFEILDWTDLNRAIIGDFLGFLNLRSYQKHGFLASALVVDKSEQRPSMVFFRWIQNLDETSVKPPDNVLETWVDEVRKAHEFFKQGQEIEQ